MHINRVTSITKIQTSFLSFSHNLSGYDTHLFIREIVNHPAFIPDSLSAIPITEENYISFSADFSAGTYFNKKFNKTCHRRITLWFLDSMRFMKDSLDNLSSNLSTHPNLEKFYPDNKLLCRKGIYPYEYMDTFDKYDETSLPPRQQFYSQLKRSHVKPEDYQHAQNVWNHYNIKTLGEYADLYQITDVLHLADIFENFRKICLSNYKLDPCHYYTAAGLSWEAMLKFTNIQLDFITDQFTLEFFERQIRGGLSTATHRFAEANNKYLSNYDNTKPSTFIKYIGANNLYGYAMSQKLPTGNFHWLTQAELQQFIKNFNNIDINSDTGYTLEVDLEYPKELHDYHNDLPFLPEVLKTKDNTNKLIANLNNKYNYVLNIKSLKQALKHGLKLIRIHRVISYHQSAWLKEYIDANTQRRAKATNTFEKDFYKLMNNVIYGKTMENIRNRVNINFYTSAEKIIAKSSKVNAKTTMFTDKLAAITFDKYSITFNKPIYIGAQILDLSKILMYEFHYEYTKLKFPIQKLCYMDCDSFVYYIQTDDFYNEIKDDISQWFDTSCYTEVKSNIPLNINKKVIGKFKDETGNEEISHFVALRAKLYSYYCNNDTTNTINKVKGISKPVKDNDISFQNLYDTLLNINSEEERRRNIIRFHHKSHDMYTVQESKIALDANDDKRIILPDKISTLALFHWRLSN